MADIPPCPKFAKGHGCPKSDPVLIADTDSGGTVWSFRCATCGCCYVISKPVGVAAARYNNRIEALRRQQESARRRESKRRIFS